MGITTIDLASNKQVQLADWESLTPPQHGKKLMATAWDQNASREGLSFYPSTDEYMRNTWAGQNMHMAHAHLNGKDVALLYHAPSDSWHSSDALDIDHKVQWKDHLKALGVSSNAEAQMGYNDVSNLRLLPAAINRARDSADNVFNTHGQNSPQWAKWCQDRFGFDSSTAPPPFDPEKDFARRHASTYDKPWTDDNTRSDLGFDTGVRNKWFESELHRSFQGEVTLTRPVPPGGQMQVPLFACAASGQLCTRDAFDIDHQIAFETLLKEMPKHAQGGQLSFGEVKDAYNDTSNLRLMSRSANASHEWELSAKGEYRDSEKEVPERRGEFSRFITAPQGQMSSQERTSLREVIQEVREHDRYKSEVYRDLERRGVLEFADPRASSGQVTQLSSPQHPDHGRFQTAMQTINRLDPHSQVLPTREHRENLAAALVAASVRDNLPTLEVADKGGKDGMLLFAAYHVGQGDERRTHVNVTEGAHTPMAFSTFQTDAIRQQQVQQQTQQQALNPNQNPNPAQGDPQQGHGPFRLG